MGKTLVVAPEGLFIDGVEALKDVEDIRLKMPDGTEHDIVEVVKWVERCPGVVPRLKPAA